MNCRPNFACGCSQKSFKKIECCHFGSCLPCLRIRNSLRPGPSLSIDGDPSELERVADEFFFGPQDDATAFESRDFEVDEADEFDSQVSIEQKSNCSHCSPTNEGISASISTDDMETPSQEISIERTQDGEKIRDK